MKPKPSFVVYVDESGDEGFAFKGARTGSSRWFVLSAVVTRKELDLETVKLVDKVREELNYEPRKPLHFRKMKHERRVAYVTRIAAARIRCVTILVHKPSIAAPEKFREACRLYNYTTRLLLERVSWLCRDNRRATDTGDGSAEIIFSNRTATSYPMMKKYFQRLQQLSEPADVRIDWDVIKPEQVRAVNHDKLMGLQIADAVASGFYYGVQLNHYGFTEPRYAQVLRPVVYQHRKQAIGHGLKFWPRETQSVLKEEPSLKWIEDCYQ